MEFKVLIPQFIFLADLFNSERKHSVLFEIELQVIKVISRVNLG